MGFVWPKRGKRRREVVFRLSNERGLADSFF